MAFKGFTGIIRKGSHGISGMMGSRALGGRNCVISRARSASSQGLNPVKLSLKPQRCVSAFSNMLTSSYSTVAGTTGKGIFVEKHDMDIYKAAKLQEYTLNKPAANEVVLKFLAAPINPSDILVIQGIYGDRPECPFVVGFEGVGEIVEVGAGVKSVQVGDWVLPAKPKFGTWRTHCIASENTIVKVDKRLGLHMAATVFLNPSTAYLLLTDVVSLKSGDSVILNGANSSCGLATIQIAKDKGIKTINVVRKRGADAEAALRTKLTNLGADIVITDEELKKRGQDDTWLGDTPKPRLAIDCVGGEAGSELVRHLCHGGSFVNYGALSGKGVTISPLDFIFRDIKAQGLWITSILGETPQRLSSEITTYIAKLIQTGKYQAPECELFLIDDYKNAMKRSVEGKSSKKQLLIMDKDLM